ncbi:13517_t:CDS:2, partial [Acaulospora colombiana]
EKHHPKLPRELARPPINPMPFAESPNARSKTITVADGPNTGGALNQHPSHSFAFDVGVAEDKGTRRTMEDSHSFVVDFDDIRGQGYFGLFDGHAGKHAAEWCGQHFHEVAELPEVDNGKRWKNSSSSQLPIPA